MMHSIAQNELERNPAMRGICASMLLSLALVTVEAQQSPVGTTGDPGGLKCTAFAISLGGLQSGSGTSPLDIVIERWSSENERQQLLEALKGSDDKLLNTLREMQPVGRIRTPTSVGWDLRYASVRAAEQGERRVVIATDRPMNVAEAIERPRSAEYPFTFIELRLNEAGEGEGKMSVATRVSASTSRFIQLENYDTQPVQLNQVRCR